jgi:hypothetical protein
MYHPYLALLHGLLDLVAKTLLLPAWLFHLCETPSLSIVPPVERPVWEREAHLESMNLHEMANVS